MRTPLIGWCNSPCCMRNFEAMHPFLDGNGRLGRMFVPLFMWQSDLIRSPMFYVSAYLEAHRDDYYERLLAASRDDDWTGRRWFFLEAVQAQAEENPAKAQGIIDLYNPMKGSVPNLTCSQYAIRAVDRIFERPVFRGADFVAATGIPKPTARRILDVLRKDRILQVLAPASGRRSAILLFPAFLNIAERKGVVLTLTDDTQDTLSLDYDKK